MRKITCFVLCLCMGTIFSLRAAIPLELVNNGDTSDSEIYWCILGAAGNGTAHTGKLCYVNPQGELIPAKLEDNDMVVCPKNGQSYPNYFFKLSENPPTYLPPMYGTRMFISKNSIMYLKIMGGENGNVGYAGPDLQNGTDPNQGIQHEFIELTCGEYDYHGNTTRVDWFFYPLTMRVEGDGYDCIVGEHVDKATVISKFLELAPEPFQNCVDTDKGIIFAPGKTSRFPRDTYFDEYMNHIWEKYKTEDMIFGSDLGRMTGRVQPDGSLVFTNQKGEKGVIARKPSTRDVLEGAGELAKYNGNPHDLAVQAQFCAAANRHVLEKNRWDDPTTFYQEMPYNFYAAFWHLDEIVYGRRGYGFCYDDVFDHSTLREYGNAQKPCTKLTVYIDGGGSNGNDICFAGSGDTGGPGDGPTGPNVGGVNACSGTEMTTNDELEYSYNFERISGSSVKVTIKALGSKTGLVLQGIAKNYGTVSEEYTTTNATLSGTFNGVEGENITIQVKWAWAGGDGFSKEFIYKLGSGCNEEPPADTEKPVITILGKNPHKLTQGESYTDAGATATDNRDGNITAKIQKTGEVNTDVANTYTITYTVSDEAGNTATATRTVIVEEPNAIIETTVAAKITGYYNLMGVKLLQEPASGIYIIVYDNGKAEKAVK